MFFLSYMDVSVDANSNVYSFSVSLLSIERSLTEFEPVFTQLTVI